MQAYTHCALAACHSYSLSLQYISSPIQYLCVVCLQSGPFPTRRGNVSVHHPLLCDRDYAQDGEAERQGHVLHRVLPAEPRQVTSHK